MQQIDKIHTAFSQKALFTEPVKKETKSVNVELSDEISLMILQKLSLKELIQTRQVNKAWLNVSKDTTIWKAMGSRLGFWGDATENLIIQEAKKALRGIQKIESSKNITRIDVLYHLNLSIMGFCSLDETKNLAFQAKYNCAYSQDATYYSLAFEYLHRNQPSELENILPKMGVNSARGVVASRLIEHYLKDLNFERAFATMDFVKTDQLEWHPCFYSIIQKACNVENYAFMTKVLKKYEALDGGNWAGCVMALQKLLLDKGKIEESNQLRLDFPRAFDVARPICEMRFYIFIHDLKRAESTALNCNDTHRYHAFREIEKYYEENKNEVEVDRIKKLVDKSFIELARSLSSNKQ